MRVFILDSTLRDGAQTSSVSFSIDDKLAILRRLDDFGIDYIDGGWPAVDPRDRIFFARARDLKLKHARLTAFGYVDNDASIDVLLEAGTPVVCLSSESRALNPDRIAIFKRHGREVIFNAENFFDAFESHPELALRTLDTARDAGADVICLCDTSGGMLTSRLGRICAEVKKRLPQTVLGIHAHNDGDLAVANSIAAVEQGFTHVQGCFNGYGERCGCANLSSILPNLELKAACATVGREKLEQLNSLARFLSEAANLPLREDLPYVGSRAFTGEDHTRAEYVGNTERLLVNRMPDRLPPAVRRELLDKIRRKEEEGYDLAAADGSFELLVRQASDPDARPFTVLNYEVITSRSRSAAEVTLEAGDAVLNGSATGAGPVNALDLALRQALATLYASIDKVKLVDYRLRVLESFHGTDAKCRALIQWSDGEKSWTTAGISDNIVEASWLALLDAVHLEIMRARAAHAIPAPVPDYSWAV